MSIGDIVTFDYSTWILRYPEFTSNVSSPLAQLYFNEAAMYCDNSACGLVPNVTPSFQRATFLNMLTAHIAALNAPTVNPQNPTQSTPASPLVGRISNASEGSVSVAVQNDYPPGTVQWYQSTKYGAAYWAASTAYRTMQYVPGCAPIPNPWASVRGRW